MNVKFVVPIPRSHYVVIVACENLLGILDTATRDLLQSFKGRRGPVNPVAVSVDGSLIVMGSNDAKVRVWDASKGAAVGGSLEGHRIAVQFVAIRVVCSHVVFGGRDGMVRIWGTESGLAVCEPTRSHAG
jgi:WD40 repeat protein